MKRTKKYLASAAITLSSLFAGVAPSIAADAPTRPLQKSDIPNFILKLHFDLLNSTANAIAKRFEDLSHIHNRAKSTNNKELLSLADLAIEETQNRIQDVCLPLYKETITAIKNENDRIKDSITLPSREYSKTYDRFAHECSTFVLPTIEIPQQGPAAGKILSDVTLDRASFLTWKDMYFSLAKGQAKNAFDYYKRYSPTSGLPYIKRMERHSERTMAVLEACSKESNAFVKLLNKGDDLLAVRRQRGKLYRVCSEKITFK